MMATSEARSETKTHLTRWLLAETKKKKKKKKKETPSPPL